MKKIIFMFFLLLILSSCKKEDIPINSYNVITNQNCNNQDAKFINDYVLTSINGKLSILDNNLTLYKNYNVNSNWVDYCSKDNYYYLISGNFQNETNLTIIDKDYNLIDNLQIFKTDNLCIDQAIIYFDNYFYFTITEIIGTVNNTDINKENGLYTIKLYKTKDFKDIEFVKDIHSQKNNLEDVELFIYKNKLAITYEEETAHHLKSTIYMTYSDIDLFDTTTKLIMDGTDAEPAKILIINNYIYLFYSSDKNNIGLSYSGSDMFYVKIDRNLNIIYQKQIKSKNEGIHLYDIYYLNNTLYCLYNINYDTTRDLVLETFME